MVLQLAQVVPSRLADDYECQACIFGILYTVYALHDRVCFATHQSSLGLDERPVLAVHFVVKATRVA